MIFFNIPSEDAKMSQKDLLKSLEPESVKGKEDIKGIMSLKLSASFPNKLNL